MSCLPARLALAALILLGACTRQAAPVNDEVRPVRTVVAGRDTGAVGALYSGAIVARHESQLAFRTPGKLTARQVEVGSAVRQGQALMQLDPGDQALQLAATTADVDAARSRADQARVDLRRLEQLLARQFAAQAEVDQQRLAWQQAEAQWKAAQAQREISLRQQGYTVLRADRDGVVTEILAEAGQVVAAGQPVLTIAGDGEREVAISIPESRVDEIRRAQVLRVSVWAHPGTSWAGRLRELAPDTDPVTRTYSARVSVIDPDPAQVRLGQTATVLAPDVEGVHALRVPLTAIDDLEGRRQVWVVDPASLRVHAQAVRLGAAQNDTVEVIEGLAGGETVVTAGVHMLHAGQRVKLMPAAASGVAGGRN